ncbi:MAG: META domain-containing protein [Burkholderiales bacterium]
MSAARFAVGVAVACGAALYGLAPAQAGVVSGTATFRERIALPPGATFEAVIEDTSRADAPAMVLGRFGPVPAGSPPFAFRIEYDDAAIMPGQRYGVRASVRLDGRLLFTTDRHVPAFAGDKPVAITMVRVKDAPAKQAAQATLRNTYWKLVAQNGKPAVVAKGQREPHIVLKADEFKVSGSGGCNNIVGGFTLDGDRLRFTGMGSTMMMCPEGMEQERDFLKMLETVARYRISGEALTLADDKGRAIAKFRAVALR